MKHETNKRFGGREGEAHQQRVRPVHTHHSNGINPSSRRYANLVLGGGGALLLYHPSTVHGTEEPTLCLMKNGEVDSNSLTSFTLRPKLHHGQKEELPL